MTQQDVMLRAIRERRSVRHYTGEPVARETVRTILDAGRWAPSGLNNQPWRFLVVFPGDPRQEVLAGLTKYARIVREAGALIMVCLERQRMYNAMKDHQGAGACIQNMLLGAHAVGLGAVWLGEIVNRGDEVLTATGLSPERLELMAVVALGHPERAGGGDRIPLDDMLLEPF